MLSVVVLTKDEESRIKACLESVKWADEIIIVDNGSKDDTLKIARQYTDKIIQADLRDFASLRNLAMKETKGEWVLYVDADERVLEPLKKELEAMVSFSQFSAYAISRKNIIFGTEVKYGPFWPDWVIRLLKKSDFEGWVGRVHEYPKFKGELGYSKNPLLHLTHRSIDQIISKTLEWSKIDAEIRFESNHPKMTGWRFLRIFLSETFNQGILRRGFFNGTVAVADSLLQVFSMVISYIRLWQLQQSKGTDQIYDEIDKRLLESSFKDFR